MLDTTLTFFGLAERAFCRPPAQPYLDPPRQKALAQLQALIRRRGFGVVTGPAGSGKTALVHYLGAALSDNQYQVIYVPFAGLQEGQFLQYLSGQMGLEPHRGLAVGLRAIDHHLHRLHPVTAVILLDEVQQLQINTAHLLRVLLHDRADTAHHCALIMVGADSFVDQTLRLQIHEALRQRITLYVRLAPLSREHTAAYLAHHLRSAGSRTEIFEPAATELIHELASGRLRLINALAEAAMDQAAEQRHQTVTLDHVHAAAELTLPPQRETATP